MIALLRSIVTAVFYLKNLDPLASIAGVVSQEDAEKARILQLGLDRCEQTGAAPSQALAEIGVHLFETYLTPKWN